MEYALSVHERSSASQTDIKSALETLKNHARITIQLYHVGGGTVLSHDQQLNIEVLREVLAKFPDLATAKPSRTHAILTRYGSLGGFTGLNAPRDAFISYDHTELYTSMLMDAFMEYKHIDRTLTAQLSGIKAGTMLFNIQDGTFYQTQATQIKKAGRFDSTLRGLAKAKRECMVQMIKIIKEVDEISKHPAIATDTSRDESFQDPLEFIDRLPRVKTLTPKNSKIFGVPSNVVAQVASESDGTISSGVWDTSTIHDWEFPMQRTEAVLEYSNDFPKGPIPNIIVGMRQIDTWIGASLRFSTNTDFVTTKNFHIGVDQWSDSILYG